MEILERVWTPVNIQTLSKNFTHNEDAAIRFRSFLPKLIYSTSYNILSL